MQEAVQRAQYNGSYQVATLTTCAHTDGDSRFSVIIMTLTFVSLQWIQVYPWLDALQKLPSDQTPTYYKQAQTLTFNLHPHQDHSHAKTFTHYIDPGHTSGGDPRARR